MGKPQLGSGACWLLEQLFGSFGSEDSSATAVITQAGTRGINLLSTLYKVDEDYPDVQTHSSTMEVMAYLYLTYDTGIQVTVNFSLYTIIEDTAPITSIAMMMLALQAGQFWVMTDNLPTLLQGHETPVSIHLKTIQQLVDAQATDLQVEESSGYDIQTTGSIILNESELALLSQRYVNVLSEPEKHPFLTSDVAAVFQDIKDEALADLKSNFQR